MRFFLRRYFLLALTASFCLAALAHARPDQNRVKHQLPKGGWEEQSSQMIYNHLAAHYPLAAYTLEQNDSRMLAAFTLADQTRLLYKNDGALCQKILPSGEQIDYDQGYPVKRFGKNGELLQQTQLTWDQDRRLRQALTSRDGQRIFRYYHEGHLVLEMVYDRKRLLFRRGFGRTENKKKFSYFETDSRTGITSFVIVPEGKGLMVQQWRVTGGLYRDWSGTYRLFLELLREEVKRQYADYQVQRRDSFHQTRGELINAEVNRHLAYGREQFLRDMGNDTISIDRQGNYIDCHQLVVPLPKVALVEQPHQPPVKVRVRNRRLFYWDQKIKDWKSYPYNPDVEKIVPLRPDEGLVVPREIKTQWQVIPGKQETLVLTSRLLLSPGMKRQMETQVADAEFIEPNQDDCRLFLAGLNAGREEVRQARQPEGRHWGPEDDHLAGTVQAMLCARIKQALPTSPEMKVLDDRQLSKAQVVMQALEPDRLLRRKDLLQQQGHLWIAPQGTSVKITYRDLKIHLPVIEKKKLFFYYNRVRKDQGFLQVWEEDKELEEKGFWRPYVPKPGRDALIQRQHKMLIRVDQGHFLWQATGAWTTESVSGTLILGTKLAPTVAGTN